MENKNLLPGSNNELISSLGIKFLWEASKPEMIQAKLSLSKEELVGEIIEHMETRNEILYFVMDNGLLNELITYNKQFPEAREAFLMQVARLIKDNESKQDQIEALMEMIKAARRDIDYYQDIIEELKG